MIIEDGHNTSYIDTLLIALFYSPTNIFFDMLECDPSNNNLIYLQEVIKANFIEPIKKGLSIMSSDVNEIRNYLFLNDWLNKDTIINQQNICELYIFLSKKLNNKDNHNPFVKIPIKQSNTETTIKTLLNSVEVTDTLFLPQIIPIFFNRFETDTRATTLIDIKEKIKLPNNSLKWKIHSVICHVGGSLETGHYYCMIHNNSTNKWLLFNNKSVPCITEAHMTDDEFITKIKQDCVFVIYKFDDNYY